MKKGDLVVISDGVYSPQTCGVVISISESTIFSTVRTHPTDRIVKVLFHGGTKPVHLLKSSLKKVNV